MYLRFLPDMPFWNYCEWLEQQPRQSSPFIPKNVYHCVDRRAAMWFREGRGFVLRDGWRRVLIERGYTKVILGLRPVDLED